MAQTNETHPSAVINGVIDAAHIRIGRGVVVEEGAVISGNGTSADRVVPETTATSVTMSASSPPNSCWATTQSSTPAHSGMVSIP